MNIDEIQKLVSDILNIKPLRLYDSS